jgi:hypothetical protein
MGDVDSETFDDNPLDTTESLDSDEVRNDDGDEVADPPERWIEAKEEESLDERLDDEVPDVAEGEGDDGPSDAHDGDEGGGLELASDDELDRLDPSVHGRERGQISGTPEDGDSFFDIVE